MSRIGKRPIDIPGGVKIAIQERNIVVEGPKGRLEFRHHQAVNVAVDEQAKQIVVTRPDDQRASRSLHGLTRSMVQNMVQGVSQGYEITLEITGVGYRAEVQGQNVTVAVGFASPIKHTLSPGVTAVAEKPSILKLSSVDKQLLGVEAAKLRSYRPPEPYKGKGIKYSTETIRHKVGKAGAS